MNWSENDEADAQCPARPRWRGGVPGSPPATGQVFGVWPFSVAGRYSMPGSNPEKQGYGTLAECK